MMAIIGTLAFNFQTVLPLFSTRDLHGGSGTFSLMMSIVSVGSLVGALATARRTSIDVRIVALTALAFGVTSWTLLAPAAQPPWVVLASVGTLLALIDLRTTWLPLRLTRLGWLLMALALGLAAVLSNDLQPLVGGCLGAAAAAALYWLVWAISRGGFGYGDVRFAPLVGAAAGSVSWSTWAWALLLGTVAGGMVGIARLVRRQRRAFPYAPSMLLGCYLALAGLSLAGLALA